MKSRLLVLASILSLTGPALAEEHESGGAHAVILAGEIAAVSPVLSSSQRARVAKIYDGTWSSDRHFGTRPTLNVNAHEVTCRWSNVDITSASCTLDFGSTNRTIRGIKAHHFIAALHVVGVQGEGAAGSVYFRAKHFECRLMPNDIADRAGAGAICNFETD